MISFSYAFAFEVSDRINLSYSVPLIMMPLPFLSLYIFNYFNGYIDTLQPSYSLRTFTGHSETVMSLDFHPSKEDLICSCDNNEIRYWSIKNGSCTGVFKV